MVIVMDMNSGKALDEACNHYNELYSDEVLYAAWVDAPRIEAGLAEVDVSAHGASTRVNVQNFMTRLSACQE